MEQGQNEGKRTESDGMSVRGLASGEEQGSFFIGHTLLRLLKNLSWSRGVWIPRFLTPPNFSRSSLATPLYYSDHIKSLSCCAAFCRFLTPYLGLSLPLLIPSLTVHSLIFTMMFLLLL